MVDEVVPDKGTEGIFEVRNYVTEDGKHIEVLYRENGSVHRMIGHANIRISLHTPQGVVQQLIPFNFAVPSVDLKEAFGMYEKLSKEAGKKKEEELKADLSRKQQTGPRIQLPGGPVPDLRRLPGNNRGRRFFGDEGG